MGHGHSHGGHSASHEKQNTNERGDELERATESNQEVTTVVIVNKVISKEDQIDVEPGNKAVNESEHKEDLGELTNNRVHTTPSRYKMGIMLAAMQADEEVNGLDVVITTSESKSMNVQKKIALSLTSSKMHCVPP